MCCKHWDILTPLTQRRYGKRENIETKIKIFPEPAFSDLFCKITVCSGNDTHINLDHCFSAKPFELTFLKNTKQFCLKLQRKLANFIKKNSSAFSQLKLADPLFYCAGKTSFFMTEKL